MPQRAPTSSNLMRPFVVLALPGMYLLYKYNQYRQQQMETARRRVTERELMHLNTKIRCDHKEIDLCPENTLAKAGHNLKIQ
ncbi:hypothetical protein PYW07_005278 [Mythimna separata]|uniref:Uncharacterized protein n=1 Tax=Mythimna separata TaxID=271217 RepID=A0AAD7YEN5_MYTSE|nr:hypothetical protein PYW07_005278 [Mythimna separata]